jgi:hypothetical protein
LATARSAATSSAFAPLGRQRLFQGGNLIQNRLAIGVHAMQ